MPALLRVRTRDRLISLACVALVQIGLGAALLRGLRVDLTRPRDIVSALIEIATPVPPKPPVVEVRRADRVERRRPAAPVAKRTPSGGSPGPVPAAPLPVISKSAPSAPSGGGSGSAAAIGTGNGGDDQNNGDGDGGGTDLVQIAGAIEPSDYPRDLRERGSGGRVGVSFEVGASGRVTACSVTRSSGFPELDALTCRLIQQRFRYRPSTDRFGRPIPDEVEGEQDWVATGG